MTEYLLARTKEEYEAAKLLIIEYASLINIDLAFQKFEEELSGINKMYAPLLGGIILCKTEGKFMAA